MSSSVKAGKPGKPRPHRPITLAPDLYWALEQLASQDGYLDVRTWLVRQLKDLVRARDAALLMEEPTPQITPYSE